MSIRRIHATLLATAFALTACGGGGGGGFVSPIQAPPPKPTPTPVPAPTPTPTPTPASYVPVIIFPNVTSSTQFATLGYEGLFAGTTAASLIGSGFSVSYDAAANNYVMDVPVSRPGVFESPDSSGSSVLTGKLTDPANPGQSQPPGFGVSRSTFNYTAWAFYQQEDSPAGWMAFGSATPSSGVPLTGSAAYTAEAHGYGGAYIDGKATLQFDFGAGALSGTFDAWDAEYDPGALSYGHFDLVNTVVGSGQNLGQFSGELLGRTGNQRGSFNGLFTGPNAEELMSRWTASYPNSDQVMYGVWIGKKN